MRSRDRQLGFVTTVSPNCLVSNHWVFWVGLSAGSGFDYNLQVMICVALRVECHLGHSGVRSRDRQLGFVTTVSPNSLVSDHWVFWVVYSLGFSE